MFRMMNANQATITPEFLSVSKPRKPDPHRDRRKLLDTSAPPCPPTLRPRLPTATWPRSSPPWIQASSTTSWADRLTAAGSPGLLPHPQFTAAAVGCSCTDTSYNALQVSVTAGSPAACFFQTNYTWGKSLDDISDDYQWRRHRPAASQRLHQPPPGSRPGPTSTSATSSAPA